MNRWGEWWEDAMLREVVTIMKNRTISSSKLQLTQTSLEGAKFLNRTTIRIKMDKILFLPREQDPGSNYAELCFALWQYRGITWRREPLSSCRSIDPVMKVWIRPSASYWRLRHITLRKRTAIGGGRKGQGWGSPHAPANSRAL